MVLGPGLGVPEVLSNILQNEPMPMTPVYTLHGWASSL